jgi:hypothetical protein
MIQSSLRWMGVPLRSVSSSSYLSSYLSSSSLVHPHGWQGWFRWWLPILAVAISGGIGGASIVTQQQQQQQQQQLHIHSKEEEENSPLQPLGKSSSTPTCWWTALHLRHSSSIIRTTLPTTECCGIAGVVGSPKHPDARYVPLIVYIYIYILYYIYIFIYMYIDML